ncbi:MAG: helix-turn-helix domain-containing protein [Clostridiales bacterium]|jgi:transcriptional regulator with XRE-family HTH domain|nr:helix-turn-helix domain-containing protein [Clostridiales bacterium]
MSIFSERITLARRATGLYQKDAAAAIGLPLTTLQSNELGKVFPTAETVVKIAEYYHLSADYLLGLAESPEPLPKIRSLTCHELPEPLSELLSETELLMLKTYRESSEIERIELLMKACEIILAKVKPKPEDVLEANA